MTHILTSPTNKAIGQAAEKAACAYLQRHGLTLVERNYTIKGGEIDLIMRDREYLIFIEVKLRSHDTHGLAIETVTAEQQQRIIKTAKQYLYTNNLTDRVYARFDIIGIDTQRDEISWIKNAFEVKY